MQIYKYIHAYILYTCIYIYMYIFIFMHIYMYIYAYLYVYIYICIYMHMHIYIYILCVSLYMCTYYIYMYVCAYCASKGCGIVQYQLHQQACWHSLLNQAIFDAWNYTYSHPYCEWMVREATASRNWTEVKWSEISSCSRHSLTMFHATMSECPSSRHANKEWTNCCSSSQRSSLVSWREWIYVFIRSPDAQPFVRGFGVWYRQQQYYLNLSWYFCHQEIGLISNPVTHQRKH